jgi:hypothetical protein
MRLNLPREFYIPKNYTARVADKASDAVAYLWLSGSTGKPGATIFMGKQAKPYSNFYYGTEARRTAAIALAFESRRKSLAFKAELQAKRKAWKPSYKVGDIFRTCWGYDQTNVEYFELVELKGKYGILRELAQSRKETGFMQGICVPLPGEYIGEPLRRLCQEGGFKISECRRASLVPGKIVAGVRVYDPAGWSSYA